MVTYYMRTSADANSTDAYLPKTSEEKAGAVGGANAAVPADPNFVFASVMTLQAWQPYPTGGGGSGAVSTTPPVETDATLTVPNIDGGGGVSSIPSFTVEADITGIETVGSTLTCTSGTVTGDPTPTITKQWKRNGVDIPAAIGDTYLLTTLDLGKTITCLVTATNSVGTSTSLPTTGTIVSSGGIANQTIAFGALTAAGTGGAKAIDNDGNEVNITAVTGGVGWSVASGRIVCSTAPAAATLTCTTALGVIQVTISATANAYSMAPGDAWPFAAITSAGGKTILLRDGEHAAPSWVVNYASLVTVRSHRFPAAVTNYSHRTGNGVIKGRNLFNAASKVRFENVRFYLPKPNAPAVDDSEIACWEFQGAGVGITNSNIAAWRCEFRSDTIHKTGYANSWPQTMGRYAGTSCVAGILVDECWVHDINAITMRGSNIPSGNVNKLTQTRMMDMGNGATSFTGSDVELSWCFSGPFWGNGQETVQNHTSMHSYNGAWVEGQHFQNILYKGLVTFGGKLRNSASCAKMDRVSYHPETKFKNSQIIGCLFTGVTDGLAVLVDNCDEASGIAYVTVAYDRNSSFNNPAIAKTGIGFYSGDGVGGGDNKIIHLNGSPDLSQVPLDESFFLTVGTTTSVGTRNVFNIAAVDDFAKTITTTVPSDTPLLSATYASTAWSITPRRSNPGIAISSQTYVGLGTVTFVSGGSGGANGTFALGFQSLASMQEQPAGTFTVAGGSVVNGSVIITDPGIYSTSTPPALIFTASAGLTGVNITVARDRNVYGDSRGVYTNNFHCSTTVAAVTGGGPYDHHVVVNTLYTDQMDDGDKSAEDGGLGSSFPLCGSYEENFFGTSFKGLTEGNVIATFTNRPWNAGTSKPAVSNPIYGAYGVGAGGGAVTWPANFETLPMAGTINAPFPDFTPAAWSMAGVNADTNQLDVLSAITASITGIDNGTPIKLSAARVTAGDRYRIFASDGTTVVLPFTNAASTINPGQRVQYELAQASGTSSAVVNGQLYIGNTSALFAVTTAMTAPTPVSKSPASGSTSALPSDNLVLTFSENVFPGSGGTVRLKKTSDNSTVQTFTPGTTAAISAKTVTMNPTADMIAGAGYYVEVDATAFVDVDGMPFAGLTGTSAWAFTVSSVTLESETTALIARMSATPGGPDQAAINNLMIALKGIGLAKFVGFYDTSLKTVNGNDADGCLNFIGNHHNLLVNGGVTFRTAAPIGATSAGALNTFLNTQFNPGTDTTTSFLQNSAHIGLWMETNQQSGSNAAGNTNARINARNSSDQFAFRLNNGSTVSVAGTISDGRGHNLASRTASNAVAIYKNGSSIHTGATVSSAPFSGNMYFLADSSSTASAAQTQSIMHFGGGLTSGEAATLYAAINTYRSARGL